MRDCGVSGDSGQPSIWARTRAVCLACTLPSLPCGDVYPTWLRVERRCVGVQTSVDALRCEPSAQNRLKKSSPCGAHLELWRVFESVDTLVWDVRCPTHETFGITCEKTHWNMISPSGALALRPLKNLALRPLEVEKPLRGVRDGHDSMGRPMPYP